MVVDIIGVYGTRWVLLSNWMIYGVLAGGKSVVLLAQASVRITDYRAGGQLWLSIVGARYFWSAAGVVHGIAPLHVH
ncbi:hypothetical protein KCP74_15860 [Salmonella enterica subsp. enterica]|nr:hypothetical protein KCP74_15860 [Salmonella enterica subsp. enterica]